MLMDGKSSPWGKIQYSREIAPGIVSVHTAGHGGLKLDRRRNAMVPSYMRLAGGWYEEDSESAIVAVTFPDVFSSQIETAKDILRDYFPRHYAIFFNVPLESLKGHSRDYDRECFTLENLNNWVVVAAWGSGGCTCPISVIPPGKVFVAATIAGGRTGEEELRYYFVDREEYQARTGCGFVIDEFRHPRWVAEMQVVGLMS